MDLETLLESLSWDQELPPMSESARTLLGLTEEQQEDPRVLSLAAQEDPPYLTKLLSRANSAAYSTSTGYVSSADAAVRRLGTTQAYELLLTVALASSFEDKPHISWARQLLLDYTLSAGITARRTAQWLGLDEQAYLRLRLGSLLLPMGLFALLLSDERIRAWVFDELHGLMRRPSVLFSDHPGLRGYCKVSAKVAQRWEAPFDVVEDIGGVERASTAPGEAQEPSLRLLLVQRLVNAKLEGQEQLPVVQDTLGDLVRARVAGLRKVDLGVYLGE